VGYECRFDVFSKRFTVKISLLTFLQNQMPSQFNALLPQCFSEVIRFLPRNDVRDQVFSTCCGAYYDRNVLQVPINFMINCLTTHGTRRYDLLRFAIFPFRDPDFIWIKDQASNTALHNFFYSATYSESKLLRYSQRRVLLRLADCLY
jgi:hypothetical protein